MPFLTDVKENDVITLVCGDESCEFSNLKIQIQVAKKTGAKCRISIDADEKIRITKAENS